MFPGLAEAGDPDLGSVHHRPAQIYVGREFLPFPDEETMRLNLDECPQSVRKRADETVSTESVIFGKIPAALMSLIPDHSLRLPAALLHLAVIYSPTPAAMHLL